MPRDYQRIKQTKHKLPRTIYHQTLWRIRDYERKKQMICDLDGYSGIQIDGIPKSHYLKDKVAKTAIRRADLLKEIETIDKALLNIPEEYRRGIWYNIQVDRPYPRVADRSTFGRYKSKFIYLVAEGLELI